MADDRPGIDRVLFGMAQCMALRGTCTRKRVGAIIARDGRAVESGYNGAPRSLRHCQHDPENTERCEISVHAEANALIAAARHGVATEGATMYATVGPCLACASLIINAGILRLVYGEDYRDDGGVVQLGRAGVAVERVRT